MSELQKELEQRIMPEPMSGCWLWTGSVNTGGYGQMRWGAEQRFARAHRLSWEAFRGPIPAGAHVLHKCDVPACINPDHLFLGTHADNMHDAFGKGRMGNANRALTHCKNGHPFEGDNLHVKPDGRRVCMICNKEKQTAWRRKRGVNPPGTKTHCKNGHPFEGDNLIIRTKSGRTCRTCMNDSARARYAKRKSL